MLWILPGNVQAPDYFLIKSVCVLVIYKRLALIFSRSCALSDDILIFHKRRIRWRACVYVFLILHCIPATLKLVFSLHSPFIFLSLPFFFPGSIHPLIVVQSVNLSQALPWVEKKIARDRKRGKGETVYSFVSIVKQGGATICKRRLGVAVILGEVWST